jgi:2,3,4,5-tetrahydropyridine-2-carboxylate N-succinyltransferase
MNECDRMFIQSLEEGSLRAAYKKDDQWVVDINVKQKILDLIRNSPLIEMGSGFYDKEALKPRLFNESNKVRLVPGGTSVRAGVFIGPQVVVMPPSFINIGAHISNHAMIDSHVLVGSCAQIGAYVHLSTGVQIGGVLEPIGTRPVIIEDHCFIGAGVIITEGIIIKEKAVLAPGVTLSASVPIYDAVHERMLKGEIPSNAVVVPGTRPLSSSWAKSQGLSSACAIIIKYRDHNTNAALILESALRE